MRQDPVDNVLVPNVRNDFQRLATPATGLCVNIENTLEPLSIPCNTGRGSIFGRSETAAAEREVAPR